MNGIEKRKPGLIEGDPLGLIVALTTNALKTESARMKQDSLSNSDRQDVSKKNGA